MQELKRRMNICNHVEKLAEAGSRNADHFADLAAHSQAPASTMIMNTSYWPMIRLTSWRKQGASRKCCCGQRVIHGTALFLCLSYLSFDTRIHENKGIA